MPKPSVCLAVLLCVFLSGPALSHLSVTIIHLLPVSSLESLETQFCRYFPFSNAATSEGAARHFLSTSYSRKTQYLMPLDLWQLPRVLPFWHPLCSHLYSPLCSLYTTPCGTYTTVSSKAGERMWLSPLRCETTTFSASPWLYLHIASLLIFISLTWACDWHKTL